MSRREPSPGRGVPGTGSVGRRTGGLWFPRCMLSAFLMAAALGGVRPMISYRAVGLGAGAAELGVVAASFAAFSLVLAIPAGRWVDRWGEARFMVAGNTLMALSTLSLWWIHDVALLALAHAFFGAGQIFMALGVQTLVAGGASARGSDSRFGYFAATISVGLVAGPAVAGTIAARHGEGAVFLLGGGALAVGALVAVTLLVRPPPRAGGRRRGPPSQGLLRASWTLARLPSMPQAMLASFVVLGSLDILVAYLPAYGEARGIAVATVGYLLSAQAAAALVSRVALGPMIALLGRRRFLALGLLGPGVGMAVVPFTADLRVLFVCLAVVGFGLGIGQPITIAWVATRAPAGQRGMALGVRQTGNRLGQLTIPTVAGLVAGAAGLSAIFLAVAALLTSSALVVARTEFEAGAGPGSEGQAAPPA